MKKYKLYILVLTSILFLLFLQGVHAGRKYEAAHVNGDAIKLFNGINHNWFPGFHYEKIDSLNELLHSVNQIPISTNLHGTIYNTVGYKKDTYLSSSGEEAANEGYYTTGYIPAKLHDTIYLYYMDFASGNPYNRIQFFDENKVLIGSISTAAEKVLGFAFDEGYSLTEFTVKSWKTADLTDTAYIRLCGTFMDENSIITVNLKAKDPKPHILAEKAESFVDKVERKQTAGSFTFAFLSDAHSGAFSDRNYVSVNRAFSVVNKLKDLDLVVHGGDLTTGSPDSTVSDTYNQMNKYRSIAEKYISTPSLWLIGNHDDAPYQSTPQRLTQAQTFALFGSKNSEAGAVYNQNCNYGYLDFNHKKMRVIYLDTHDKRDWGTVRAESGSPAFLNVCNVGAEQLKWLVDTGLNFTDKENPAEWGIIITSHAELDSKSGIYTDPTSGLTYQYNTSYVLKILNAYQQGQMGTIFHNGISIAYDFSNQSNQAKIYCAVNGHGHKYTHRITNGIQIIGCPNIYNGRERVSDDGVTYKKTIEGTSFCVITIDPDSGSIYADSYGAGYDRVFHVQ